MSTVRRELLRGVTALALAGGVAAVLSPARFASIGSAGAQPAPREDLMDPGPLPDKVLGAPTAPVTIIEYVSMTCTHCAQFAITTFPDLKARFIDSGKVRYIIREFPLDAFAIAASMLARCAGDDQYYTVVETLLKLQGQWKSERIQPLMTIAAKHLGFTHESFHACLANRQLLNDLSKARERAIALGINSIPTFFINGKKHRQTLSMAELEELIAPHLKA